MSLDYIRAYYNVPAKRGAKIAYTGGKERVEGRIVGVTDARLKVRLDGSSHTDILHPTWQIEYIDEDEGEQS